MNIKDPVYQLRQNLKLGYSLAVGRHIQGESFSLSTGSIILLIIFITCLDLASSWIATPLPSEFNIYGLSTAASSYLVDLVILISIFLFIQIEPPHYGKLIIGYLSTIPVINIISSFSQLLIKTYPEETWLSISYSFVVIFWMIFIMSRLLEFQFELSTLRKLSLANYFVFASIFVSLLFPQDTIWREKITYTSEFDKYYKLDTESIFYAQPRLLEKSLSHIAAHTPNKTDLYLIAFAGYGYENVFLNEVEYVKNIFDQNFNTQQRSLILANNLKTIDTLPLANYHNLKTTLKGIAERINPEEDIVLLFMTSHGSSSFQLSVNFGSVRMNNVTPEDVKNAFEEAGIIWKVIIISSCYSGGFIEPLKDDHSLIITASDSKNTSFGCGTESEFTDFGTAYFKKGLEKTPDLIEAFTTAKDWVIKKETIEKRTPSNPQIFTGKGIASKLEEL